MGKREYIALICKAMVDVYGETLLEDGTDLDMAKKVFKVLKPYLKIHARDMSRKEWSEWRKKFFNQKGYQFDYYDIGRVP